MVRFPPPKEALSTGDIDAIERGAGEIARDSFIEFRKQLRPNLIDAWWQIDVAEHLTEFWEDLKAGLRPSLVLQAPPQHGKTEQVQDFIAWVSGQEPDLKTIFGSYSEDLGIRVNMGLQRTYTSKAYRRAFPNTKISAVNISAEEGRWKRNSNLIEYINHGGSFRNTTIMGQINGMGLDFGVIDDPIKGRAEAQSKVVRDKTWAWLTDDFFGRFSNDAGMLLIMTRWHMEDPAGRWLEQFPHTKVLRYPAIAVQDDEHRSKGEPLFPQLKSLEFLLQRKKVLTQASWESIYQQRPIASGGDMFPVDRFKVVASVDRSNVKRSVRYVDKAGTEDGGAYTAASLVHDMKDGTTVVEDVIRGQWSALEREKRVLQAAEADVTICPRYQIWFEQEPGSGGKESAEASVRRFKAFGAFADKVTGDKAVRAEPYAAQVQAGQVYLKAAEWNRDFLDEHEVFPSGKFRDQVDATAGAFNKLAAQIGSYRRDMDWVG